MNVTLGLPYSASCRQAETDIVSATEAIGFPGRVAIKKRAGAIRLFLHGLFNYWADINPASPEWVASNKVCTVSYRPGAFPDLLIHVSTSALRTRPLGRPSGTGMLRRA